MSSNPTQDQTQWCLRFHKILKLGCFSFHQLSITAGWTKTLCNEKFAWHFYFGPETYWSWARVINQQLLIDCCLLYCTLGYCYVKTHLQQGPNPKLLPLQEVQYSNMKHFMCLQTLVSKISSKCANCWISLNVYRLWFVKSIVCKTEMFDWCLLFVASSNGWRDCCSIYLKIALHILETQFET